MPRKLYTREQWEAKEPKHIIPIDYPVERAIFSYGTKSLPCKGLDECKVVMKKLQLKHFRMGMSDIAYNFLVSTDGNIYEGRGWGVEPSQRLRYKPGNRVDIAFIGRFTREDTPDRMRAAGFEILLKGFQEGYVVRQYDFDEIVNTYRKKGKLKFSDLEYLQTHKLKIPKQRHSIRN